MDSRRTTGDLRTLASCDGEVTLELAVPPTMRSVLDNSKAALSHAPRHNPRSRHAATAGAIDFGSSKDNKAVRKRLAAAMAPMIRNGFGACGYFGREAGAGDSCERSSEQAKKRRNARRCSRVVIAECAGDMDSALRVHQAQTALCGGTAEFERYLAVHMSQRAEMRR